MAANCNYLYTTDGSRWAGGKVEINRPDGTTLLIGADDLGKVRKEFGRDAVVPVVCVTKEGVRLPLKLDMKRSRGRSGRREKKSDFTYENRIHGLGLAQEEKKALLREQIRTLPYGGRNPETAVERFDIAVITLEHGTVGSLLVRGEAPNLIALLARAHTEMGYRLPRTTRGGTMSARGISPLDARVILALMPAARALLEIEDDAFERFRQEVAHAAYDPAPLPRYVFDQHRATGVSLKSLITNCQDRALLELLASGPADEYDKLARKRLEALAAAAPTTV